MVHLRNIAIILLATVSIGAVLATVYADGLRGEFIFDDHPAIVDNESIRQLWPLWGQAATGGPINPQKNTPLTARPLVNLSFAVNYHLGVLDPFGYRVGQLIIHGLATLLLWRIVLETLRMPRFRGRWDPFAGRLSFVAALVWALHPLNTESVNYVTQRTELMMGLFYLLTLYACIRYWCCDRAGVRWSWLIVAGVAGWLGILSKETMATLPALAWLYRWTFVSGNQAGRDGRHPEWVLYVVLASCWLPIAWIYAQGYVTPGGGFGNKISALDWWNTQSEVVFLYLKKSVWPSPLLIHYSFPTHHSLADGWTWVLANMVLVATTCWAVYQRTALGFALAAFYILLSPTLIVPLPGETVAERRMYVPLAALVPWATVGLFGWLTNLGQRSTSSGKHASWSERLSWLVLLSVVSVAAFVTHARMPAYRTQFTIWHDNMVHHPEDYLSTMNVGAMLAEADQVQDGLPFLEKSIALNPDFSRARYNLGRAYESLGRNQDAMKQYDHAIRLGAENAAVHYNLARLLESAGKVERAMVQYREACRMSPDFAEAHTNLGILLIDSSTRFDRHSSEEDQLDQAIHHFRIAMTLDPDAANSVNLLLAYQLAGKTQEAIPVAEQAIRAAKLEGDVTTQRMVSETLRALRAAQDSGRPSSKPATETEPGFP